MSRYLDVFLGSAKVGSLEQDDQLAPLYDLVSTQLYPELSLRMAMKIGKAKEAAQVRMKHWLSFFDDAGLGPTMAIKRMKALASKARQQATPLAASVPLADGVARIVEHHASGILALGAG
jgi:serine/threonine-protein kinase HipA